MLGVLNYWWNYLTCHINLTQQQMTHRLTNLSVSLDRGNPIDQWWRKPDPHFFKWQHVCNIFSICFYFYEESDIINCIYRCLCINRHYWISRLTNQFHSSKWPPLCSQRLKNVGRSIFTAAECESRLTWTALSSWYSYLNGSSTLRTDCVELRARNGFFQHHVYFC